MSSSEEKPAREDGYYWVRLTPRRDWEVAYWNGGDWFPAMDHGQWSLKDGYFEIVGPRIPEPT